jgi:hypothetical protein
MGDFIKRVTQLRNLKYMVILYSVVVVIRWYYGRVKEVLKFSFEEVVSCYLCF